MKLNSIKEWFEQHIERDGEVEVAAGIFETSRTRVGVKAQDQRSAVCRVIRSSGEKKKIGKTK